MRIYYQLSYNNEKGESHRLLSKAIAAYLCEGDSEELVFSELSGSKITSDAELKASEYVSRLQVGKQGKPYIDGLVPFSISHSVDTWAVLFSRSECGLDIQYSRRADASGIARRFFASEDAIYIADHEEEFFRLWARREALVKAAGTSAAESSVPSVLPESVYYRGCNYSIRDIVIPGIHELSAAICILSENIKK